VHVQVAATIINGWSSLVSKKPSGGLLPPVAVAAGDRSSLERRAHRVPTSLGSHTFGECCRRGGRGRATRSANNSG
jgi:hypothetical protein